MTTKETIQTSINNRLTSPATKIEGGTVQDIIGSVSYELANIIDTKMDTILDNAFVTTADEEHLLIKGGELGITKKDGLCAYVFAKITNAVPGTVITTEVKAKTEENIVFRAAEEVTVDDEGAATVKMVCLEIGTVGNIKPGTLCKFYSNYEGLTGASITNDYDGYDGFEKETVESYRERILEYIREDSCNSNIADYIRWAKSVPSVENVVVYDATKAGAGNVNVYISPADGQNVSDELIQRVKNKIEEEQIINAKVNVFSLEYFPINISATVSYEENADAQSVLELFEEGFNKYLKTKPTAISYLHALNLLFGVEGIKDIFTFAINGEASSVEVDSLKVPVVGTIDLTDNLENEED